MMGARYSLFLGISLLLLSCTVPVIVGNYPPNNRHIDGFWRSTGNQAVYKISQNGNNFSWIVKTFFEQATGHFVNDQTVRVRWNGDQGPGDATGTIGEYDAQGDPIRINWSNGTAFIRLK